jgi:phage gpG-like protein
MISGYLIGDKEVIARLEKINPTVRGFLQEAINTSSLELIGYIRRSKLSGNPLHQRSGRLKDSITSKITDSEDLISGIVGTNVEYARVHEYGFKGTETVKAHLRTIKQAWGRPLRAGAKQINIRSHSRKANLPERSFLRSSLRDLEGKIKKRMEDAVRKGLEAK